MHTTPKILLAGPWVGEFGWELFCWQGFIRRLSKDFDKTIVIGRPDNGILYEDFCDEYIEFDPKSFKTDAWNCHGAENPKHLITSIPHTKYISGIFEIGKRYSQQGVNDIYGNWGKQDYHKYFVDTDHEGYDIIFHCRNKSTGSERNWSKTQWEKLMNILPDDLLIACIGNDEAYHLDGADDLRGINLTELVGIMNNSDLIVGQSSGPIHLASLCGLKHLVWSTEFNRVRYERDWNPFGTECIFYSKGGWNPEPKEIKRLILENI